MCNHSLALVLLQWPITVQASPVRASGFGQYTYVGPRHQIRWNINKASIRFTKLANSSSDTLVGRERQLVLTRYCVSYQLSVASVASVAYSSDSRWTRARTMVESVAWRKAARRRSAGGAGGGAARHGAGNGAGGWGSCGLCGDGSVTRMFTWLTCSPAAADWKFGYYSLVNRWIDLRISGKNVENDQKESTRAGCARHLFSGESRKVPFQKPW